MHIPDGFLSAKTAAMAAAISAGALGVALYQAHRNLPTTARAADGAHGRVPVCCADDQFSHRGGNIGAPDWCCAGGCVGRSGRCGGGDVGCADRAMFPFQRWRSDGTGCECPEYGHHRAPKRIWYLLGRLPLDAHFAWPDRCRRVRRMVCHSDRRRMLRWNSPSLHGSEVRFSRPWLASTWRSASARRSSRR